MTAHLRYDNNRFKTIRSGKLHERYRREKSEKYGLYLNRKRQIIFFNRAWNNFPYHMLNRLETVRFWVVFISWNLSKELVERLMRI